MQSYYTTSSLQRHARHHLTTSQQHKFHKTTFVIEDTVGHLNKTRMHLLLRHYNTIFITPLHKGYRNYEHCRSAPLNQWGQKQTLKCSESKQQKKQMHVFKGRSRCDDLILHTRGTSTTLNRPKNETPVFLGRRA